jgi:uncharacterized protein YecE (DUF72 family)
MAGTVAPVRYPRRFAVIRIGTSGFDYADWRGYFYPEGLPKRAWLAYFADHFSCLELNFSYYRMPEAGNLASMVERTGGRVTFAIKAHKSMTHDRFASDAEYRQFLEALRPFREAERLGAVLAQFPNSFRQCEENRSYLKRLADALGPPLAVELRNADWATDPILDWLRRVGVGFTCVDEPRIEGLMPPSAAYTADPAYVRFHGRNAAKWYSHDRPEERYDYRYAAEELTPWAVKIAALHKSADNVLVFFNNHFQGKAVESAKMMEKLVAGMT